MPSIWQTPDFSAWPDFSQGPVALIGKPDAYIAHVLAKAGSVSADQVGHGEEVLTALLESDLLTEDAWTFVRAMAMAADPRRRIVMEPVRASECPAISCPREGYYFWSQVGNLYFAVQEDDEGRRKLYIALSE